MSIKWELPVDKNSGLWAKVVCLFYLLQFRITVVLSHYDYVCKFVRTTIYILI